MLKWILGGLGVAAIAGGAFFFMHAHDDHDNHDDHGDMEVVEHGDLEIIDVFVTLGAGTSDTAAAFFVIENDGDTPDRLIEARSDIARVVELHTHIEENGVMKMRPVENGFDIPANGVRKLERAADHVMFLGVDSELDDGDTFALTLVFENAGEVTFDVEIGEDGHEGHNH
ncbi:MAG: copper chaperone PCu(A)C [Pseudomonadota bacterium]